MEKGDTQMTDVMVMFAGGLLTSIKKANCSVDLKKEMMLEYGSKWNDPRKRSDDNRSTWWCPSS